MECLIARVISRPARMNAEQRKSMGRKRVVRRVVTFDVLLERITEWLREANKGNGTGGHLCLMRFKRLFVGAYDDPDIEY